MIVCKFGGTSVASAERILNIIEIIKREKIRKPILVVSAISGVTDLLLSLGQIPESNIEAIIEKLRLIHERLINSLFTRTVRSEIIEYVDKRLGEAAIIAKESTTQADLDQLVSFGEIISSYIITRALNEQGVASQQVIATNLIVTDNNFTQAEFLPTQTEKRVRTKLQPLINRGIVPVVSGFIGSTRRGQTTTLGRGGSDYSASIIGYCLGVEEVQIWTDVDGIYTADPRVVKNARLIPEISYREASEMASFGSKVLHPRTIRPAVDRNIPVRVLNTLNSQAMGTLITSVSFQPGLKVISSKKKTTLINIYSTSMLFSKGFLARVFEIFAMENISIDLVSVSEVSISVTLDNDQVALNAVVEKLKKFSTVAVNHSFGMISLIGEGVASFQHLMTAVSELFHKEHIPIRMISLGASDINISLVLNAEDIDRAINLVHDRILLRSRVRIDHRIHASFAHRLSLSKV